MVYLPIVVVLIVIATTSPSLHYGFVTAGNGAGVSRRGETEAVVIV
jgi:hypothetical protein